MSTLFQIILTILFVAVVIVLLNFLVNRIFNISNLLKKPKLSDAAERENGIIYNPKTKELEADQSAITLF